ncbi:Ppx/GppA family phosphatase [Sphingomicrobium lutaoense]|uniref:Exopolyphosphatase/guanosine-5'-triphosphate, 3'-diphosphate pyrophosphatase n=1 Tax=Sphingomicrobium lutaoense TaxID=515949 RepID=A0A839YTM5_9SPHN|nr:Ppx/GppA family phosphatase [Sphingomicrobium lutaoense]MBB3763621.1 exopolyphosphatase/guanosine-5'-triphosphate,3'-diphosphate pyrophosphatase [Sphingomicrobium lutaoense]
MSADVPFGPVGIIDIGSNSVRLVVYGGSERVPSILFNEKVMAGLGRSVGADGRMDEEAMAMAIEALGRFRIVTRRIGVKRLRTVATAAVRDAENGPEFLAAARKLGLKPRLLSGEEEAVGSAYGVISAIPEARGVVADLGGGSLELAVVGGGVVSEATSLPLGVLRVGSPADEKAIAAELGRALSGGALAEAARGEGLYLVGGSFRAVAMLDMELARHPLPIVHAHDIKEARLRALEKHVRAYPDGDGQHYGPISSQRIPHLPAAIAILRQLGRKLQPASITTSAYGLREGLLYGDLPARRRGEDPLLAEALEVGRRLGRFGDHGALLDQWIAPLFKDDSVDAARLRLAACLLGDIAWNAHPDFRAERAVDLAVHGNWVGIDAQGRALLGRALYTAFGGNGGFDKRLRKLLAEGDEDRAECWGRAIRLAQRLSAGTEALLKRTAIGMEDDTLVLTVPERRRAMVSEAVLKRLGQLGEAMGRESAVRYA